MKLKHIVFAVFALALVGGLGLMWLAPTGPRQAPDIALVTLQGKKLDLQALRGRPVLVNFWATTCPGCIKEMPQLVELYKDLAPQGLEVIGIAMAYDPPDRIVALSEARRIPYPIVLDINSDAARAFGNVRLTPTSFIIAPDGRVVHRKIGELDMHKIRKLITAMLVQPPLTENQTVVN